MWEWLEKSKNTMTSELRLGEREMIRIGIRKEIIEDEKGFSGLQEYLRVQFEQRTVLFRISLVHFIGVRV